MNAFSNENNTVKIALSFYEAAKKEMLIRIREREIATYVWLGVLGTILTISYSTVPPKIIVLMLLPVIAIGISMRIAQHEKIVGKLSRYCKEEVGPILKKYSSENLLHWDESQSLLGQRSIVLIRSIVNSILIIGPCCYALIVNKNIIEISRFIWYFNLFLTLWATYFLFKSCIDRYSLAISIKDNSK